MEGYFDPESLAALPPVARRYLRHAIAPGTPIATAVRLRTHFVMWLREGDASAAELPGREDLERDRFVWRARTRLAGLPVRVSDDYADATDVAQHMLIDADRALYASKNAGRSRHTFGAGADGEAGQPRPC